jgi:hypothetical protein
MGMAALAGRAGSHRHSRKKRITTEGRRVHEESGELVRWIQRFGSAGVKELKNLRVEEFKSSEDNGEWGLAIKQT